MANSIPFSWDPIAKCLSRPGPTTFFELGANNGDDSKKLFAMCKKPCRYFAFEPDPRNLRKISVNGLPSEITVVSAAVGAAEGEATFYLSADNWTASSSLRRPHEHIKCFPHVAFIGETHVPVVTLDGFCERNHVDKIDFMWADVQGAERDVIAGAKRMTKRTRYMFLERSANELYEGQWVGTDEMLKGLGDGWEVVVEFPSDVLFVNKDFEGNVK